MRSEITPDGEFINYVVESNAFLMHQVRRMIGSLVDLGRHIMSLDDLAGMFDGSIEIVSNSLPPYGLYLDKVYYDGMFDDDVARDYSKVSMVTSDKGI